MELQKEKTIEFLRILAFVLLFLIISLYLYRFTFWLGVFSKEEPFFFLLDPLKTNHFAKESWEETR